MRDSSPALGGAIVGASMLFALVYAMGYSHQFSGLLTAFAAHCGVWLSDAYDTVRQAIAASG